ncbi:MAG: hypothetical protein JNM32_05585 [Dechloromonas sp.]|nr:hypothetical protein [Dechloromonas sp.]
MSATRNNLLANVFQQAGGALLFLFIPGILDVQEFGRVTVITTLLSLAVISDIGFSHVYSRAMPGVLAGAGADEILRWDVAASISRICGGAIFGLFGAGYFWFRTGYGWEALLLIPVFPSLAATGFLVTRSVAASDFQTVRNLSLVQSIGRLISIPTSAISGVSGWVIGQLISAAGVLVLPAARGQLGRVMRERGRFDGAFVQKHLSEALLLCLVAGIWTQLMASARLFAVIDYSEAAVARYGLVASLYQVGASVILAAFVPQTVRLYRLLAEDVPAGVSLALRHAAIGGSVVFGLALIGAVVAVPMLAWLFPKYGVQASIAIPVVLSVVNCAIVSILGSVMIGTGNARTYVLILGVSFVASMILPVGLSPWLASDAAAISQLLAMSTNSVLLVIAVVAKFGHHTGRQVTAWVCGSLPLAAVVLAHPLMSLTINFP